MDVGKIDDDAQRIRRQHDFRLTVLASKRNQKLPAYCCTFLKHLQSQPRGRVTTASLPMTLERKGPAEPGNTSSAATSRQEHDCDYEFNISFCSSSSRTYITARCGRLFCHLEKRTRNSFSSSSMAKARPAEPSSRRPQCRRSAGSTANIQRRTPPKGMKCSENRNTYLRRISTGPRAAVKRQHDLQHHPRSTSKTPSAASSCGAPSPTRLLALSSILKVVLFAHQLVLLFAASAGSGSSGGTSPPVSKIPSFLGKKRSSTKQGDAEEDGATTSSGTIMGGVSGSGSSSSQTAVSPFTDAALNEYGHPQVSGMDVDEQEFTYGVETPSTEPGRLQYLRSMMLDDLPDQEIEEITKVCQEIFRVPMVLVSIVESERQWFKSAIGLGCADTAREASFCAHTLLMDCPEVLYVPDATQDRRFCYNPLVRNDPKLRLYCGCPIIVEGVRLGALCILDTIPRVDMTRAKAMLLCNFADIVSAALARTKNRNEHFDMLHNSCFLLDLEREPEHEIERKLLSEEPTLLSQDTNSEKVDIADLSSGAPRSSPPWQQSSELRENPTKVEKCKRNEDGEMVCVDDAGNAGEGKTFGRILYSNRLGKQLVDAALRPTNEAEGSGGARAAGRSRAGSASATLSGGEPICGAPFSRWIPPGSAQNTTQDEEVHHFSDLVHVTDHQAVRDAIFSRAAMRRSSAASVVVFLGTRRNPGCAPDTVCYWHPAAFQARPHKFGDNMQSVVSYPYVDTNDNAVPVSPPKWSEQSESDSSAHQDDTGTASTSANKQDALKKMGSSVPAELGKNGEKVKGFVVIKDYDPSNDPSLSFERAVCKYEENEQEKARPLFPGAGPNITPIRTRGDLDWFLNIKHKEKRKTSHSGRKRGKPAHDLTVIEDLDASPEQQPSVDEDDARFSSAPIIKDGDAGDLLGTENAEVRREAGTSSTTERNNDAPLLDASKMVEGRALREQKENRTKDEHLAEGEKPLLYVLLVSSKFCQACTLFREFYCTASVPYNRHRVSFAEVDVGRSYGLAASLVGEKPLVLPMLLYFDRHGTLLGDHRSRHLAITTASEFRGQLSDQIQEAEERETFEKEQEANGKLPPRKVAHDSDESDNDDESARFESEGLSGPPGNAGARGPTPSGGLGRATRPTPAKQAFLGPNEELQQPGRTEDTATSGPGGQQLGLREAVAHGEPLPLATSGVPSSSSSSTPVNSKNSVAGAATGTGSTASSTNSVRPPQGAAGAAGRAAAAAGETMQLPSMISPSSPTTPSPTSQPDENRTTTKPEKKTLSGAFLRSITSLVPARIMRRSSTSSVRGTPRTSSHPRLFLSRSSSGREESCESGPGMMGGKKPGRDKKSSGCASKSANTAGKGSSVLLGTSQKVACQLTKGIAGVDACDGANAYKTVTTIHRLRTEDREAAAQFLERQVEQRLLSKKRSTDGPVSAKVFLEQDLESFRIDENGERHVRTVLACPQACPEGKMEVDEGAGTNRGRLVFISPGTTDVPEAGPADTPCLRRETWANCVHVLFAENVYRKALQLLLTSLDHDSLRKNALSAVDKRQILMAKVQLLERQCRNKGAEKKKGKCGNKKKTNKKGTTVTLARNFENNNDDEGVDSTETEGAEEKKKKEKKPPYAFSGTIRRTLETQIKDSQIHVYGGNRSSFLASQMRDRGLDARQAKTRRVYADQLLRDIWPGLNANHEPEVPGETSPDADGSTGERASCCPDGAASSSDRFKPATLSSEQEEQKKALLKEKFMVLPVMHPDGRCGRPIAVIDVVEKRRAVACQVEWFARIYNHIGKSRSSMYVMLCEHRHTTDLANQIGDILSWEREIFDGARGDYRLLCMRPPPAPLGDVMLRERLTDIISICFCLDRDPQDQAKAIQEHCEEVDEDDDDDDDDPSPPATRDENDKESGGTAGEASPAQDRQARRRRIGEGDNDDNDDTMQAQSPDHGGVRQRQAAQEEPLSEGAKCSDVDAELLAQELETKLRLEPTPETSQVGVQQTVRGDLTSANLKLLGNSFGHPKMRNFLSGVDAADSEDNDERSFASFRDIPDNNGMGTGTSGTESSESASSGEQQFQVELLAHCFNLERPGG
eukprot:GSA120T00015463001.1